MNPQVLIDGIQHGSRGVIVLLDNRRKRAISGLQRAQYGVDFATNDHVAVDYKAWAHRYLACRHCMADTLAELRGARCRP